MDLAKALRRGAARAPRRCAPPRCGLKTLRGHCKAAAARRVDRLTVLFGVLDDRGSGGTGTRPARRCVRCRLARAGPRGRRAALELMADKQLAPRGRRTGVSPRPAMGGAKPFPLPPVPEGEDESEALPPDPAKAKADWAGREGRMANDCAWQSGHPLGEAALPEAFDALPLETRRDVYFRLRSRGAGEDLELEALAGRQRRA
jgi:hypothetical protein